ncbi:hypothetical protein COLO4_20854 [Corchorus olitorius]|uniref:FAR1 domain-containing protein n=1 Tax=Corchorus olitorius TaxID=93759 RepID=A0A1R3IWH8_9ROSI|nr:hypothetical protein COLO4_20854 [Corchorus olitorius]
MDIKSNELPSSTIETLFDVSQVDHFPPMHFNPINLGMEFNSEDEAYEYYNAYAREIGFSIRKEYVNRNKKLGYVTSRKFTCFKEGHREVKKQDVLVKTQRKETRTDCLAHIIIRRQSNGKYQITDFEENHNHPLAPKPCTHMLPSQRKITEPQSYVLDLADDSGLPPKLAFEMISRESGGRESLGFTSRDKKNIYAPSARGP